MINQKFNQLWVQLLRKDFGIRQECNKYIEAENEKQTKKKSILRNL